MERIADRLSQVRAEVRGCAVRHHRSPGEIALVAVSKTRSSEEILAAARAGQRDFGENYLQEAEEKIRHCGDPALCWHFIGPVQSNKTQAISRWFTWVHTLDRLKIARRLNRHRGRYQPPLKVLIQVNISQEETKSGIDPEGLAELAGEVGELSRLELAGLMCLPAPSSDPQVQRVPFRQLRELRDALQGRGMRAPELSMGTSADFPAAIAEGATLVRIGTAIFGPRSRNGRR